MRKKDSMQALHDEWKEMATHLSKKVPEGYIHDKLYDQLSWLKKQLDQSESLQEGELIFSYFNEVVESFNQELKLDISSQFKKQ